MDPSKALPAPGPPLPLGHSLGLGNCPGGSSVETMMPWDWHLPRLKSQDQHPRTEFLFWFHEVKLSGKKPPSQINPAKLLRAQAYGVLPSARMLRARVLCSLGKGQDSAACCYTGGGHS
jgi:hypothetical protein